MDATTPFGDPVETFWLALAVRVTVLPGYVLVKTRTVPELEVVFEPEPSWSAADVADADGVY